MDKLKLQLEKLKEKNIIVSFEFDEDNQIYICDLNKDYFKEYDYLRKKFYNDGYILEKYNLSLKFLLKLREDKERIDNIDECFTWSNNDNIQDMVNYHNNFTGYHLINNILVANNYGVWDLDTDEGKECVLMELRNLERISMNMFILSNMIWDNHFNTDDFMGAINIIYNDMNKTHHNLTNNDDVEEDIE